MLSMLDRLWHPDLTQEEAVQLMEKGIEEVSGPPCGVSSVHRDINCLQQCKSSRASSTSVP